MPAFTAPSAKAAHLIGSLVPAVDVVVASGFRTLLHGTASLGDDYGVDAMVERTTRAPRRVRGCS
jgi:hypothetical protein